MNHVRVGWALAAVCAVLALGCEGSGASGDPKRFEVVGQVMSARGPVPDAEVTLGSGAGLQTRTDAAGRFSLSGVAPGTYTLNLRYAGDGAPVETERPVNVDGNLVLEDLSLPLPLTLTAEQGTRTPEETRVRLSWPKAFAQGFREYQVYESQSPRIEPPLGIQPRIVSITNRDTSSFEVPGGPRRSAYYRVFVKNDLGQFSGSDVVAFAPREYIPPEALTPNEWVQADLYPDSSFRFHLDTAANAAYLVRYSGDVTLRLYNDAQQTYLQSPRADGIQGQGLLVSRRAERVSFQVDRKPGATKTGLFALRIEPQPFPPTETLDTGTPRGVFVHAGQTGLIQFDAVAGTHYRLTSESSATGGPQGPPVYLSVFGADLETPYVWDQRIGGKGSPKSLEFTATTTERVNLALLCEEEGGYHTVTLTLQVAPGLSP
jgi:hypothetical protein